MPLGDGVNATAYNFCDVLPASISGSVADCLAGQPLSGVTVELLNSTGTVLKTTTTNSSGNYQFTGLLPGVTYGVEQLLPAGYMNHETDAGSAGGTVSADVDSITQVSLADGAAATAYNFCDVLPASISGNVGDCQVGIPLAGVTVELLNANGTVLKTTTTDTSGNYQFTGLMPGVVYGVEQVLPNGYLNNDAWAGSAGGVVAADDDSITQVSLGDGVAATAYNFCDVQPVGISGLVAVDTTGNPTTATNLQPLAGVTVNLLDSNGNVIATTVDRSERPLQLHEQFAAGNLRRRRRDAGQLFLRRGRLRFGRRNGRERQLDRPGHADQRHDRHELQLLRRSAGHDLGHRLPRRPADHGSRGHDAHHGASRPISQRRLPAGRQADCRSDALPLWFRRRIRFSISRPASKMSATTDANGFYEFTNLPGNQLYSVAEQPLSEQPEVAATARRASRQCSA